MVQSKWIRTVCLAALCSLPMASMAQEDEAAIYGSQLMTQEERQEHMQKMRSASSDDERAQIRQEHHERMRLRAKEKGVELPEAPPQERGRIHQQDRPGSGMGPGAGNGSGMGSGTGSGRER